MARQPPPEFPVRTYPSPVIADQVLIEWITSELASSSPIEPNSPHPNIRDYPGFKLGIQRVNPVDPYFTQRVWVTDATAQDTYNYALKYSGDSVSHPIFVRTYREPEPFVPRARGSALQTVYLLVKVLSGSGYTPGTQPALSFAGGGGSGAAGHALVAADGTIADFVLTATGSGYTSAPTVTCAPPTSGVTATLTASIQPTGAILVAEDVRQYPDDSEFNAKYFNVIRVYETLPGPLLPFTRYDDLLGPVQGTRQAVVNTGQASSLTATSKITYDSRDGSSYVSWKLTEDWSASAGSGFPITYAKFYDNEKGPVAQTTQIEVKAAQVGTFVVSGGVVTETRYDEFDPFHYKKVVLTWAVPTPLFTVDDFDPARGAIQRTTQIIAATGSEVGSSTQSGGTVTKIEYEPYNNLLLRKTIETWTVPRTLHDQVYDRTFDVVYPSDRIREASGTSIGTAHAEVTSQGDGTDITRKPDLTALAAALDAYVATFPTTVDLSFPPELIGVDAVWETSAGNGDSTDSSVGASAGNPAQLAIVSSVEAQGSAGVMPEIIPHYKIVDGSNSEAIDYYFFLPNPVSMSDVITKLTALAGASVTSWPRFFPNLPVFVLRGQKVSGSVSARAKAGVDLTDTSTSTTYVTGDGLGQDFGSSIGSRTLERCIHDSISLNGDATMMNTVDLTAEANADVGYFSATGGPRSETLEVNGSITPTTLSATDGAITVPTSGLRLKSTDINIYGDGYSVARCRVVDFAQFA